MPSRRLGQVGFLMVQCSHLEAPALPLDVNSRQTGPPITVRVYLLALRTCTYHADSPELHQNEAVLLVALFSE